MSEGQSFIMGIIVGLLAMTFGGLTLLNHNWREEAVAKGKAEYYLDKNQAKWRWKE